MTPRSILFFISSLNTGGAELHLLNLCRYLAGRGVEVSVCPLKEGGDLRRRFEDAGAAIYDLPLDTLRDLARSPVRERIREIVEASSPDILHAHLYHAEVVAALAARQSRLPLVVTRHSAGLEFGGVRRLAAGVAGRMIDSVIAVSPGAAEEALRTGVPRAGVVIVPNGVDTSRFRPAEPGSKETEKARLLEERFPGTSAGTFLIGSLGGLKRVKNFPLLLRAFSSMVSGGGIDARLMMIGEGPSREGLEELAAGLGIGDLVSMPGSRERPEEYLPLFDVFVLPSISEGMPVALIEAMSCGVACAGSRAGGIPWILGDCGVLFDSGDVPGLAGALRRLHDDASLREDLGLRARTHVMENFDEETWGSRTLSVYEKVLSDTGRDPL